MREINPEHIKALKELMNRGPFYQLLSMRLCEVAVGYALVEVDLQDKHHNPFGTVHGGAYSAMIDTAAYWSAYCELNEGVGLTTIDLNVNLLAMAKSGLVSVEGRSLKVGRSLCLTEASVKDESGRLLAHGTSKLMVLQGKQSIATAIQTMDHTELPPKFL
ncbi:MAG: PaaI family thioesterase [Coriobacteriales bacterium]|jgi:uncharacterized protein (TIGR00369 family)|nr:PaaI family thioesterase [Coriobacteriales bacterium]